LQVRERGRKRINYAAFTLFWPFGRNSDSR
jgi:hypothetical protein